MGRVGGGGREGRRQGELHVGCMGRVGSPFKQMVRVVCGGDGLKGW